MNQQGVFLVTAVAASLFAAAPADADPKRPAKRKPPVEAPAPPPAPPEPPKPWAEGVPTQTQTQANQLFSEANQLFAQQAHAPALEKYAAAIALWDHPMIRFNMAVTMVRLDRILEAAETLEAALRFGTQPFTPELYQRALDYQRLVTGRIGTLTASCAQAGGQVQLDGKPWFSCPGKQTRRVMSGAHAIVAEAPGYLTISRKAVVEGGGAASEQLDLVAIDSAVRLVYPRPRWIPWTAAGLGVGVALGGFGVWFSGRRQLDRFESVFAQECPAGCEADLSMHQALADQRDGALLKGKIGVSMMIAGGVVAVTGVVWATVFNRARRVLPDMEVAPTSGGMTGAASWRF